MKAREIRFILTFKTVNSPLAVLSRFFGVQEALAQKLGKNQPWISRHLTMLKHPGETGLLEEDDFENFSRPTTSNPRQSPHVNPMMRIE
jgi:hypothetical protein